MSERLAEILEKYKNTIVSQLKSRITSDGKIATGDLHNSISGIVEGKSISIFASEYWYVVNYGRKPGSKRPPIRPILDWMKVKGIKDEGGERKTKSLAWVIAKKIGDEGIQGTNFFWETINSIVPLITKDIEQSYLKDINDQINGNTKT
tara:strand:- start:6636 stop:7082 length:447 start_codon:yes stop_codon:yes gene_type:complete